MVMKTSYQVNRFLKVGASLFANRRKEFNYYSDNDGLTNPCIIPDWPTYFSPYDKDGNYNYDLDIEMMDMILV